MLDGLEMETPTGAVRLSEPLVTIRPGERVLVTGAMGAGKTLLTHTLAGLWCRGHGGILALCGERDGRPLRWARVGFPHRARASAAHR